MSSRERNGNSRGRYILHDFPSRLSGKLCGWLLEDLHSKQLYSETFHLEVWTFFLQFAVIYIHRKELVLIIGTQFIPGFWVILPVPTDIWIEQCQACDIQCCSSTSSTNKYKEGDQARMLLGLRDDLAKHGSDRGLEPRGQRKLTCKVGD